MARDLNPPPPPPDDPFDGLRKLPEVCETLAAWLDYMNLITDSSAQTLNELFRTRPELFAELLGLKGKGRKPRAKGPPLARFALSATLKWGPVSAQLFVDGRTVRLSPTLGILAELLLDDGPLTAQTSSGWKPREDLRLRLAKRSGRKIKKGTFDNLIYRLKKALRNQAGLGWMVETGGPLGVRFALQKYVPRSDPGSGNGNQPEVGLDKNDPNYGAGLGGI